MTANRYYKVSTAVESWYVRAADPVSAINLARAVLRLPPDGGNYPAVCSEVTEEEYEAAESSIKVSMEPDE
jgi:hypothetical protein